MDKKITKVTLIALLSSLLASAVVHAEQEVANSQDTNAEQVTTATANPAETPTDILAQQAASTEQQPPSPVESVTPYKMFVTEELFIFVHSGSSNRYRITGRIAASEEVEVIAKDTETGWLQVNYQNDKSGWVDNSMLTQDAGTKVKLAQANKQIATLNAEITRLKQQPGVDVEQLQQQLTQLKNDNQQLLQQVETLKTEKSELEASVQQIDETRKILDKLYDVGVILIGVFIGWLLSRRKRSGISFSHL